MAPKPNVSSDDYMRVRYDADTLWLLSTIQTYNTDQQTPDSAGTASAFMTGEKTRAGIISLNQKVPRGDCLKSKGNEAKSLLHYSMEAGMLLSCYC